MSMLRNTMLPLMVLLMSLTSVSCKSKFVENKLPKQGDMLEGHYLESTIVIKSILGRDYRDTTFMLLDSIANIKSMFLDSFCLASMLTDTVFSRNEIFTALNSQYQMPPIWTQTSEFKFRALSSKTLDSLLFTRKIGPEVFEKAIAPGFWQISYPIFLHKGEYCIVGLRFQCGELCGNSRVVLCKRQGTKWLLFKTYCQGVS